MNTSHNIKVKNGFDLRNKYKINQKINFRRQTVVIIKNQKQQRKI